MWQGAVRPLVVVDTGKGVQEGLELGEGGGMGGPGAEPVFEGLLKPLDFALGLGVVRAPVFLPDSQAAQVGFQAVAATTAGPVTRWCAVRDSTYREWSSSQAKTSVPVPPARG